MPTVSLTNEMTLALSVRDRHASAAWYAEKLGFGLRYHMDEAGWSELDTLTPNVVLGLGEQEEPKPGNLVPVFGVEDIATARAALEAEDVRFDGPTETIWASTPFSAATTAMADKNRASPPCAACQTSARGRSLMAN